MRGLASTNGNSSSRHSKIRYVVYILTVMFAWLLIISLHQAKAAAMPAPTSTEYPITTSGSSASQIAKSSDGTLWFTESSGGGKIGKLTTAGVMTEYSTGSTQAPVGITIGPDNNIWFTMTGNKIGKMTPTGTVTIYTVPGQNTPQGQPSSVGNRIVTGPDNSLWFDDNY